MEKIDSDYDLDADLNEFQLVTCANRDIAPLNNTVVISYTIKLGQWTFPLMKIEQQFKKNMH